ncbi:MAG: M12 family metallo-peptidase, partial [Planctomycetota bacterium]
MPLPRHPFLAIVPALLLALGANAQAPALLTPIANPPASALAWLAGERTANATIVGSTFVQVNTTALLALPTLGPAPLGTLTLALGGTQFLLDVDRADWSLGYRTFRGTARGEESEVHLTLAADGTTAGLIDVDGGTWLLTAGGAPGVHALLQIDTKREPASNSCGVDHTHLVRGPVTATAGQGASQLTNSDCAQTTLDIAVFYTPEARLDAGGQSAIETVIVGAVSQANAGHLASGAPIEFRLVHMAETNYVETGSGADLGAFRDPSDGQMDEVHQARNDYGADLMHLIVSPNSSSFCGIGYLLGSLSSSFESSAFAVTRRTCISNRTFTHECGHNMGCHHDAANAGAAIFPYAYGYRTPDNALRTIMAYSPGTRINRWSSPNVVFQGYTMG